MITFEYPRVNLLQVITRHAVWVSSREEDIENPLPYCLGLLRINHIDTAQARFRPGGLHVRGSDVACVVGLDDLATLRRHYEKCEQVGSTSVRAVIIGKLLMRASLVLKRPTFGLLHVILGATLIAIAIAIGSVCTFLSHNATIMTVRFLPSCLRVLMHVLMNRLDGSESMLLVFLLQKRVL